MTRRDWLWIGFVVWIGLGIAHERLLLTLMALACIVGISFPRLLTPLDGSRKGPRVVEVDTERDDDLEADLGRKREPRGWHADRDIDDLDI